MKHNPQKIKSNFVLGYGRLAQLFTQLKQLENAGLPASRAFAFLATADPKLKKPLLKMQQQINAGRPISEAGYQVGIFNDTLKTLVSAGETSGRLAAVYGQLADFYGGLDRRRRQIKSRLMLPVLVLTLALFIQPLPALVAAEISGFDYLRLSLGRLIEMGLAILLLIRLPGILAGLGVQKAWHRLQLRLPWVAKWLIRRQVHGFLVILAMLLESGIAFESALPKAIATLPNSLLREQFNPALQLLGNGASVTECLRKVAAIDAPLLGIINSSEQSGKLAGGLLHFTYLEAQTLSCQDEALAEWLPRLVYLAVVIWIAYSLISSKISLLNAATT